MLFVFVHGLGIYFYIKMEKSLYVKILLSREKKQKNNFKYFGSCQKKKKRDNKCVCKKQTMINIRYDYEEGPNVEINLCKEAVAMGNKNKMQILVHVSCVNIHEYAER